MKVATLEVLSKIEKSGYKAYAVGGYPRDLYLKRDSMDIDICTNATPQQVMEIFDTKNTPGIQYGSMTVLYKNNRFEITTFRKEIKYENNRIPVKIEYIDDLLLDLKRRDFVMNTLCLDSNGRFLDLLGAKEDIDNKIINTVGSSKTKIREDSLRILRAIRFATVLNFKLSDSLKKSIKRYGKLLRKLSYHRKKEELDKIFSSKNAKYGIELLKELKLTNYLELYNLDKLVITSSSIGVWAQLDKNLKYTYTVNEKKMISKINTLINYDLLDRYVLYKNDLFEVFLAAQIKGIPKEKIVFTYNDLKIKSRKDIMINSDSICEILGIKKGPILKEIYEKLEIGILNDKINNDYDSIRKFLLNEYKK